MRELEFRAWLKDYNKMLEVYPRLWFPFGEAPLMQYTGLKDKNGKKIFEGDVVKFKWWNLAFANPDEPEILTGVIMWCIKTASFVVCRSPKDEEGFGLFYLHMEVIGNLYENPELLENNHE